MIFPFAAVSVPPRGVLEGSMRPAHIIFGTQGIVVVDLPVDKTITKPDFVALVGGVAAQTWLRTSIRPATPTRIISEILFLIVARWHQFESPH